MIRDFHPLKSVEVTPVYGVPGSGKTSYLVNVVRELVADGEDPKRIVFCSYTKTAASEGARRCAKALGMRIVDFQENFGTIHSIAKRNAKDRRKVMSTSDYRAVGTLLGMRVTGSYARHSSAPDLWQSSGDFAITAYSMMRARMLDINQMLALPEIARELPRYRMTPNKMVAFIEQLEKYKRNNRLLDFEDMLADGCTADPMDIDFAVVDEAQDLSLHQWAAVDNLFSRAHRVWAGGDDDQAIFDFSGGESRVFRSLASRPTVVKLQKSHRCPRLVFDVAARAISGASKRVKKTVIPREEDGEVHVVGSLHQIDMREGEWLLLVRRHSDAEVVYENLRNMRLMFTSAKGESCVPELHKTAIRAHERLRAGKTTKVRGIPAYYKMLDKDLVAKGKKSKVAEAIKRVRGDVVDTDELVERAHLLPEAMEFPWYEALTGISASSRAYYRTLMEAGQFGKKDSRIRVSTIHGAKGTECPNVVVVASHGARQRESIARGEDHEYRIAYVAATRAKERLYVVLPTDRLSAWKEFAEYTRPDGRH